MTDYTKATMTPQHKENIRRGNLNKKRSPETRERMRQAAKARWAKTKKKVGIDAVIPKTEET